jgi:hypothetical protein
LAECARLAGRRVDYSRMGYALSIALAALKPVREQDVENRVNDCRNQCNRSNRRRDGIEDRRKDERTDRNERIKDLAQEAIAQ